MMGLRLVCRAYKLLVIAGLPEAYLEFKNQAHFQASNPILRISYFTGLERLDMSRSQLWELSSLLDTDLEKHSHQYFTQMLPKFEPFSRLQHLRQLSLTNFLVLPNLLDSLLPLTKLTCLSLQSCHFLVKGNGGIGSATMNDFLCKFATRLTKLSLIDMSVVRGNTLGSQLPQKIRSLYEINSHLSKLTSLTSLTIGFRQRCDYTRHRVDVLPTIADSGISHLTNLRILNLTSFYCGPPIPVDFSFSRLVSLVSLHCRIKRSSGNFLKISDLNSPKLRHLDVQLMDCLSLVSHATELVRLRVRKGFLVHEDTSLHKLTQLTTLIINCNLLDYSRFNVTLPTERGQPLGYHFVDSVSKLLTLTRLEIKNSSILNEDFRSFASLKFLKALRLVSCPHLTDAVMSFPKDCGLMSIRLERNVNFMDQAFAYITTSFPVLTIIQVHRSPLVSEDSFVDFFLKRYFDIDWHESRLSDCFPGGLATIEYRELYNRHCDRLQRTQEDRAENNLERKRRIDMILAFLDPFEFD